MAAVLAASCSSSGDRADDLSPATVTEVRSEPVATGSGPLGAQSGDCESEGRFDDDPEFAIALCELQLVVAATGSPPSQWEQPRADAIALYEDDRESALDQLYAITNDLAATLDE